MAIEHASSSVDSKIGVRVSVRLGVGLRTRSCAHLLSSDTMLIGSWLQEEVLDGKHRCILQVLKESLDDHPQDLRMHSEVRYKLIIDPSEDDSLLRHLFKYGVLQKEKTYTYVCSDLVSDSEIDKVGPKSMCTTFSTNC